METYDINLGTQPLANKLDTVSKQVGITTGAVAAMETAVIAQEKSSADQICDKLDVGFFNVVMGQVAQRMAAENAVAQALAMELIQQQKALQNLQSRMSGDYNMISSRYAKLFGNLNQELKNRITDLDKPVIQYCSQDVKQLQNRINRLVSNVPVLQSESTTATQSIAAAHIKKNAQELITTVADYIKNDSITKRTTRNVWAGRAVEEGVYYIPMIVDEEDSDNKKGDVQLKDNLSLRDNVDKVAYQYASQTLERLLSNLEWKEDKKSVDKVIKHFLSMVEDSLEPKRIKDKITSLFNDHIKTL